MNARPGPKLLNTEFSAVAVVLSLAGNHKADRTGGAPKAIGPPKPFRNCPILLVLTNDNTV